jgi:phenylacetate-coenzyme A ligase PaaK-like adenylate-forming protein
MLQAEDIEKQLFRIDSEAQFEETALEIFRFQFSNNSLYHQFVESLSIEIEQVDSITKIPFLPIEFFKSHIVETGRFHPEAVFSSSGTTGITTSKHYVKDLIIYQESMLAGFKRFFGKPSDYVILALLPSYLEREGSSLVYMSEKLIKMSKDRRSGFCLHDYEKLSHLLSVLKQKGQKTLLIGVTYALLDLAEQYPIHFPELILMETGGMKGKRKEMVREELHEQLKAAFGVAQVYSEYGMTELLSQAYSKGNGIFNTPPWMKVLIRDVNDPLSLLPDGKSGGINVIDLANLYSCSFIATQDLGKKISKDEFEILGRFDNSDVRGCNLLVQ